MTWPIFEEPPSVAFLDVDGTLLPETTSYLFGKLLNRRGMINPWLLLKASLVGIQHKFGKLDYRRLLDYGFQMIREIPVVELERTAYENFRDQIKPRLYEGVVAHLNDLRFAGTPLVLVSSSPRAVLEPLAIYLGCADILSTPIRIEQNHVVGLGEGPPCYGEGKLYWATKWAQERGLSMSDATAYADNWSDRQLLERVGHAVVVRPGRRLKRLARERGWTIVQPARSFTASQPTENEKPN